jgi:hypothetical protein
MDPSKVGEIIMRAAMKDICTMPEALAAVAWVHDHADIHAERVQQPPSLARATATKNVSGVRARGDARKQRANNVFQRTGRLKCTEWLRAIKICQEEEECCVPHTGMPPGFPKAQPKRKKDMERLEWRGLVDDYSLALMETFGHRQLVKSKNPDYHIRSSVWRCGECGMQMRTNLTAADAWADLQLEGVTQGKVDASVRNLICELPPAPTCRTPTCQTPTCKHPMCQTPLWQEHMPHTPFSHSLRFGGDGGS